MLVATMKGPLEAPPLTGSGAADAMTDARLKRPTEKVIESNFFRSESVMVYVKWFFN